MMPVSDGWLIHDCPFLLSLSYTRRQMQKVAIQVATEAMAAENAEEKDVRMRRPFPSTQLATLSGDCLRPTARHAKIAVT